MGEAEGPAVPSQEMDVLSRLREVAGRAFSATPVRFAYLFGSHARGTADRHSDVDVAVMLDDAVPPDQRLELSLDLAGILERMTGVGDVQVLVLNEAPLPVAGRVIREGRLFYSVDEPGRVAYESLTFRRFVDFEREARALDVGRLRAHARGDR